MSRAAVFLDRDGVLNRAVVRDGKPYPPETVGAVELCPGVLPRLQRLKCAGFVLIAVTNQPDVARGKRRREAVEAINRYVQAALGLDALYTCYDDGDSPRRKPNPGLLLEAAADFGLAVRDSYVVGDRWKDVEAGRRAGCTTVFVDYRYRERRPDPPASYTADSPSAALDWIVSRHERSCERAGALSLLGAPAALQFAPREAEAVKKSLEDLRVKVFADGADKAGMLACYRNPLVKGFTTNPTLLRKAGVADYAAFAREVIAGIPDRPISFEVLSDHHAEMEEEARLIASWGPNVYVKIPVTNSLGLSSMPTVGRLARQGVPLNVTAVFTLAQVEATCAAIAGKVPAVISIFAGRIADTGVDPCPLMAQAKTVTRRYPRCELLWASPREVLNIFQADEAGCDIITVSHDLLAKLHHVGKDLVRFSLETVQMLRNDATKAGYCLRSPRQAA